MPSTRLLPVLLALVVHGLGAITPARAQTTCNTTDPPCAQPSACRRVACSEPSALFHLFDSTCAGGGSFNLIGTRYEHTCLGGCPEAGTVPPIRFWGLDQYRQANSGCANPVANWWIGNSSIDFGRSVPDGHWVLLYAEWASQYVDGCPTSGTVVAEISDVVAADEGTPDHRSFYLVAATGDQSRGFAAVRGGTGCEESDLVVAPVSGVEIVSAQRIGCGLPPPCEPDELYLHGTSRPGFGTLGVQLEDPSPRWYTWNGAGASPQLIAGFQIVYATGATRADAPASSDFRTGRWLPARDPSDPSLARGVVPVGTTGIVPIALPIAPGYAWVAARLVYADPTVNPLESFDPLQESGPLVTSPVSHHSGPVDTSSTVIDAVLVCMRDDDGVPRGSTVAPGTPFTLSTSVTRPGFGSDEEPKVQLCIPDCLDRSAFDPVADPGQVELSHAGSSLTWYADTGCLWVEFPRGSSYPWSVTVRGLRAGGPATACCPRFTACTSYPWPMGWVGHDVETGCGATCFDIAPAAACPTPPEIVSDLRAAKAGDDVRLSWAAATDAATERYNVWKVTGGNASLIPLANKTTALAEPAIVPACLDRPRGEPFCSEEWGVTGDRGLDYYQVRGVCADGSEGTAHP